MMNRNSSGRIAMRIEGDWWVAYYALPDTMKDALPLGRVNMAVVQNKERKEAFIEIFRSYIAEIVPEFETTEAIPAPEHERSSNA